MAEVGGGGDTRRRGQPRSARRSSGGSWRVRLRRRPACGFSTVYLAFQTKSGLLRTLWNLLLRGDQSERPVAERRWYLDVLEEPDPEQQLRLNACNSATGKQRIAGMLEVIRSAAAFDPDVAALWQRIQTDYHANQRAIIESLNDKHALAPGLDIDRATDILWTLNHPNTWQLLVTQRGWTPEQYEQWLAESACAQLLGRNSTARVAARRKRR